VTYKARLLQLIIATVVALGAIGSLLLGLYTDDGTLASVGVIGALGTSIRVRRREHGEAFLT